MNINGPILSSTSVGYICLTVAAIAYFTVMGFAGGKRVDPAETAAIAATCQAKGMVARHEVGGGYIRTFCEKPEEVK